MLNNSLSDAVKELELQYQLTDNQQKECDEYFSGLKPGDLIHPAHLKSVLHLDIKSVYEFLELLQNKGLLQLAYEVYCRECGSSKGIFIDSIVDFNPDWRCDFCDNPLNAMDNLIVLYKTVD